MTRTEWLTLSRGRELLHIRIPLIIVSLFIVLNSTILYDPSFYFTSFTLLLTFHHDELYPTTSCTEDFSTVNLSRYLLYTIVTYSYRPSISQGPVPFSFMLPGFPIYSTSSRSFLFFSFTPSLTILDSDLFVRPSPIRINRDNSWNLNLDSRLPSETSLNSSSFYTKINVKTF